MLENESGSCSVVSNPLWPYLNWQNKSENFIFSLLVRLFELVESVDILSFIHFNPQSWTVQWKKGGTIAKGKPFTCLLSPSSDTLHSNAWSLAAMGTLISRQLLCLVPICNTQIFLSGVNKWGVFLEMKQ